MVGLHTAPIPAPSVPALMFGSYKSNPVKLTPREVLSLHELSVDGSTHTTIKQDNKIIHSKGGDVIELPNGSHLDLQRVNAKYIPACIELTDKKDDTPIARLQISRNGLTFDQDVIAVTNKRRITASRRRNMLPDEYHLMRRTQAKEKTGTQLYAIG